MDKVRRGVPGFALCSLPPLPRPASCPPYETVGSYLESLETVFVSPAQETLPSPDLGRLREAGIPTVTDEELAQALTKERDRRRLILGALQNDARR